MRCKTRQTLALILLGLAPQSALAETFEVGPGKPYATIQDTLELLKPGDVVAGSRSSTSPPIPCRSSTSPACPAG
ncbi:hypothetical protein SAMN02745121_06990 [Nannocystis exedens]|uniref:Uncharacterized protein n=1 Tax=Nannocystis exedens TaxID=54 RepID=A0A1I2G1S6_9BACT|nr:hypothetical protein [Nannocystis exedens]SFF11078.1 hypothetical protein SAMN02745121_06990 [Nannocystis exedens]